ncbi:MAG: hypothetical protein H0U62_01265 [Actinobacteria bacterium]|jgi:hypothetical protein|nr:hypothetical protein [Actinomycetota bacterium]
MGPAVDENPEQGADEAPDYLEVQILSGPDERSPKRSRGRRLADRHLDV